MARISIGARLVFLTGLVSVVFFQGVSSVSSSVDSEVKAEGGFPRLTSGGRGFESRGSAALAPGTEEVKSRPKRCTCYSYRDKECVYYCHLDIIWINTPERTVPYGMSSYIGPLRLKRAAGPTAREPEEEEEVEEGGASQRCVCVGLKSDHQCRDFCQSGVQH